MKSLINFPTCSINMSKITQEYVYIQGGPKTDHFYKCIILVYNDIGRRSKFQLFIRSQTGILNVAIFKYSLHKIRETILDRKYQLI